jgi:hypothetical protein
MCTPHLTGFTAWKAGAPVENYGLPFIDRARPPMSPAWTLRAWPPVLWQADRHVPLHFVHRDTRVSTPGDTAASPGTTGAAGQTVWVGPLGDGEQAGVAWDWVQLSPGVLAIADPMAVVTNLRLLGPDGEVLTAWQAARHLNAMVHGLPWQGEVERVLAHADGERGRMPQPQRSAAVRSCRAT